MSGRGRPVHLKGRKAPHYQLTELERRFNTLLTPRLEQIYHLLLTGGSGVQLAHKMGISVGTFKVYCSRLYQRIKVQDRYDLISRELAYRESNPEDIHCAS